MIGLMMQAGTRLKIEDVHIKGVRNLGKVEFTKECGKDDPEFKRYAGADSRGVAIVASRNVVMKNVSVSRVSSEYGNAVGVDVFNGSTHVCEKNLSITNVRGKSDKKALGPLSKC